MKALVTGVAGFIGSHLAEELLKQDATVIGLDCFTDYYPRATKEANLAAVHGHHGFMLVEASLQQADLARLLDGVTHVFHLAAQAGVRKSWGRDFQTYVACNVEATQVLLEACVANPPDRFVYASSSSVYGNACEIPMRETARPQPVSPYGVTKLAAEHLCHLYWVNHGVPTVSLRYFTVYGPRQRPDMAFHRFLRALLASRAISLYGDGEQTRDFTFVDDAVAATLAAADHGTAGRVYNIGGGSRVSMNEVIALLGQVVGRAPMVSREGVQKGDMRDTYADTSLARTELGFQPRMPLAEGLEAEYRWLARAVAVV